MPAVRFRSRWSARLWDRLGVLISEPATARRWMLAWGLFLVVTTLWLPHPTEFSRAGVLPLLAAMIATCLSPVVIGAWPALNWLIGAALLVELYLLVGMTGAENSVYVVLYLGFLVYGAMFFSRFRMTMTYVIVALLVLAPRVDVDDLDPAALSREIVELGEWGIAVVSAHLLVRHLRKASTTDALTGLTNHGTFWELAAAEHHRSTRYGHPYSLLVADIDLFKQINDRYGHRAGDRILREVADVLRSRARAGDVVARYGGEEFVVLLPETDAAEARVVAEDLRRRVTGTVVEPLTTLSIGVASWDGRTPGASLETVLDAADQAMYAAKRSGRNRVSGGEVAVL